MCDYKRIASGELPRFHKWSWSTFLKRHLLTQCILSWTSLLAGSMAHINETIETRRRSLLRVARCLGIPNERIIFYSISSGGASGLSTAAKIPGSVAIASNPQLYLTRFLPSALANLKSVLVLIFPMKRNMEIKGVSISRMLSLKIAFLSTWLL